MARRKRKRIASRGSVNNIILKTLTTGDKYGYEIIKEVEKFSDGKIVLKQPSLYSSLSRFEEKKFVSSYWGDSDIGGRRHYYHLTDEGMSYYKRVVLKEGLDDEEDIEDYIDEITSDNTTLSEDNQPLDSQMIDEESEEEYIESNETNESDNIITEISEDEIPAIANFEITKNEDTQEIIPDHQFHQITPMENIIQESESQFSDNHTSGNLDKCDTDIESQNPTPWLDLADNAKESNKKIANSKFKVLYLKKPKKIQKVVLDRDGIYKLRDEDYIETNTNKKPVIIDNVIKRTDESTFFGYNSPYAKKENKKEKFVELSEEEKRQKNENFLAKFNLLTNSKMKPVSTPIPEKKIEKQPEEKPIDYRSKLDKIIQNNSIIETEPEIEEEIIEENNLFNYEGQEEWNQSSSIISHNNEFEEDHSAIDLEPVQEFETKTNDSQYIEEINNYPTSNSVKLNRYEHKSQAVLMDKSFVLINKLRFVFGIIMTLIMIAEVTISLFAFKNNNLIVNGDKTMFICAYCAIGVFALAYILPFCINSNQHKQNNFKFKYSIWFGVLTFLICSILVYCINALCGFEIENLRFFAVKLFVPIILLINFIIGPIIYLLLHKRQMFYD